MTDLNSFLWFGYDPTFKADKDEALSGLLQATTDEDNALSLDECIRLGARRLKEAFSQLNAIGPYVVPISGGLDSRAILAGLLENYDSQNIYTYTYGVPGTYDFDIGNLVAKIAGTRHRAFDLSAYSYDMDTLLDLAHRVSGRTALFQHSPFKIIEAELSNFVHVSGFMGEALSGAHLLPNGADGCWTSVKRTFAERNRYSRRTNICEPGFDPVDALPEKPFIDSGALSYDDQLDFYIRQQNYIRPLVLLKGMRYEAPFLSPIWTQFILSLPRRYRYGQNVYKEILRFAYPTLFDLPAKASFGLPLNASAWRIYTRRRLNQAKSMCARFGFRPFGPSPMTNYIDFAVALRERLDLQSLVLECLLALKRRRIIGWINVESLWREHQSGRYDLSASLLLLASLEINLRAKEM